jgi:hypothetical protein
MVRTRMLAFSALVAVVLGAAGQVPAFAVGPASPAAWQHTATSTGIANISWLSCGSSTSCVAYGGSEVADEVAGSWQPGAAVPNLAPHATISAIACPSPGNCTVGGAASGQAFLEDEVHGVWGDPQLVAGTAPYTIMGPDGLNAVYTSSITSISCPPSSSCTAAGNYTVVLGNAVITYAGQGFATSQSGGTWSAAVTLPGVDAVTALACTSVTSCTVSGFSTTFRILVVYPIVTNVAVADAEVSGTWGSASTIPGLTNLAGTTGWIDSQLSSMSCTSQGNCTVGGLDEYAPDFDGNPISLVGAKFYGFVSREVNGNWRSAVELKALSLPPIVSCWAATQCVAADAHAAYAERNARWGAATRFVQARHKLTLNDASCSPNGPCVVVGSAGGAGYAISETATGWATPTRLGNLTRATVVSCPSRLSCTAAGGSLAIRQV